MRPAARVILAAVLLLCFVGTGWSYTRPRWQIGPEIKQSRWPLQDPIPVVVNTDPPNAIVPGSQPFLAIRNTFELRSLYTPLRFSLSQSSYPESIGLDGTNLVTFKDTPENRSAVFNFGAVTWFWWSLIDDEPVLIESDIVFSPFVFHTSNNVPGAVDIESLGGHELIHFMSFDHSGVIASTAYPNIHTSLPSERNLALDDLAAGGFLHPFAETPSKTGSLTGTIEKPGGVPVFGAHVVAQRALDGAPVSDISVLGGEWRIDALPPGRYSVYVEPLDGPAEPSNTLFSGIYRTETVDVDFQTTFAGGNASPESFVVAAGEATEVGTIQVPATSGPLNLRRLGVSATSSRVIGISAVNVRQGELAYLTLHGPGVEQVPDEGVEISGSGVRVNPFGVNRGSTQGYPYMIVPLRVDAAATPGVRTVFVNDGSYIAALTGGVEVQPSTPYPSLLRNDELTSAASVAPVLQSILPLDASGPDGFRGTGEGLRRQLHGSDDDDDFYAPQIASGFEDPDTEVLTDTSRPLVLYELDDPSLTLVLGKSAAGRLTVFYVDAP